MAMVCVAYSYLRFSTIEQGRGDSVRRQTALRDGWLARNPGVVLDDVLKADRGVSARKGKNALVGNLGAFLRMIEAEKVKPGSILLVESLDRITRQGVDEGYDLCKKILKAGVRIVTLSPEREYGPDAVKGLMKGALEIQLILERAAEESQIKSERVRAAYQAKKLKARAGTRDAVSGNLPAWCKLENGRIVPVASKAEAVRAVFRLAARGYGGTRIVKKLADDMVPAIGRKATWVKGYVTSLLNDRRVLGEYQPTVGDEPDGPPVPGHFPRIITDEEWYAARAGAVERKCSHGRQGTGAAVNIFQGYLLNATTGETLILRTSSCRTGPGVPVLASESGKGWVSFPYAPFERMVLSSLAEIDPAEVIGAGPTGTGAELKALSDELAEVRGGMESVKADLAEKYSRALSDVVRALGDREEALLARIEEVKARAAKPLTPTWADAQNLARALEEAQDPEDVRLRLRSAMRRIIDHARVLIVTRHLHKLAALQVYFRDGAARSYLLHYRRRYYNFHAHVEAAESARSFAQASLDGKLDLREPADVARVKRFLLDMELPGKGKS